MWVPHKKKSNQTINMSNGRMQPTFGEKIFFYLSFFSFIFLLRFTSFGPSEFIGINTESALRDEGFA